MVSLNKALANLSISFPEIDPTAPIGGVLTGTIMRLSRELSLALILILANVHYAYAACATAATKPFTATWAIASSGGQFELTGGPGGALTGSYTELPDAVCKVGTTYLVNGNEDGNGHFILDARLDSPPPGCAADIIFTGQMRATESCNVADISWVNSSDGSGSTSMSHPCFGPSDESLSQFVKWGQGDAQTIATFQQYPIPTNYNWGGRRIREYSPSEGTDTCWFSNPDGFYPVTTVTGNSIRINGNTPYKDDIGASTGVVLYYRAHKRAPCGFHVYQQMIMSCDGSEVRIYTTHVDQFGIGTAAVTATRGNGAQTRGWLSPAARAAAIVNFLLQD